MKTISNILVDMWNTAKSVAVTIGISALTVMIVLFMAIRNWLMFA